MAINMKKRLTGQHEPVRKTKDIQNPGNDRASDDPFIEPTGSGTFGAENPSGASFYGASDGRNDVKSREDVVVRESTKPSL